MLIAIGGAGEDDVVWRHAALAHFAAQMVEERQRVVGAQADRNLAEAAAVLGGADGDGAAAIEVGDFLGFARSGRASELAVEADAARSRPAQD